MTAINPFDDYEAELIAKFQNEKKAEEDAWNALSPAEQEAERLKADKRQEEYLKSLETQDSDDDDDEDED